MVRVEVRVGNIVGQPDVDALINSANANLRFGSGVAGAIHSAAGPELEAYCRPFAPLGLGEAVITPGFRLPNRWIIHLRAANFVVDDEPEAHLAAAVRAALKVAEANSIKTFACPAIGTGVFKFPPELAAAITADEIRNGAGQSLEYVRLVVAGGEMQRVYTDAFRDFLP